jgi:hypothetical protein
MIWQSLLAASTQNIALLDRLGCRVLPVALLSYYLGKMSNPQKAELIAQALQPNFMDGYAERFEAGN